MVQRTGPLCLFILCILSSFCLPPQLFAVPAFHRQMSYRQFTTALGTLRQEYKLEIRELTSAQRFFAHNDWKEESLASGLYLESLKAELQQIDELAGRPDICRRGLSPALLTRLNSLQLIEAITPPRRRPAPKPDSLAWRTAKALTLLLTMQSAFQLLPGGGIATPTLGNTEAGASVQMKAPSFQSCAGGTCSLRF